jgi:hypothetical protein
VNGIEKLKSILGPDSKEKWEKRQRRIEFYKQREKEKKENERGKNLVDENKRG